MSRIEAKFDALKKEGRAGLVTFITAGDPDQEISAQILSKLPEAGADIIELGVPFTDPMADGPAIQAAGLRALESGATLRKTLDMVRVFRESDQTTPIILMGYYNPVYRYKTLSGKPYANGVDAFIADALDAGVDGTIIVDLPPEEDDEFCIPATKAGLSFIRLATPTTDEKRLPEVLKNSSGFLYYVAVAGVTGSGSAASDSIENAVTYLKKHTDLPVAVGFGIKTPEQAKTIALSADAVVVGSAIVDLVAQGAQNGDNADLITERVYNFVRDLAEAVRTAK